MPRSFYPQGVLRGLAGLVLAILLVLSLLHWVPGLYSWSTAVSLTMALFFGLLIVVCALQRAPWYLWVAFGAWFLGRLLVHVQPVLQSHYPVLAANLSVVLSALFGFEVLALAYVIFWVFRGPVGSGETRPTLGSASLTVEAVELGLVIRLALLAASFVWFYRPLQFAGGAYYDVLRLIGGLLLFGGLVWLGAGVLQQPTSFPAITSLSFFIALAFLVLTPFSAALRFVPTLSNVTIVSTALTVINQVSGLAWYVLAYLVTSPDWITYHAKR